MGGIMYTFYEDSWAETTMVATLPDRTNNEAICTFHYH
jgi:hypothetical protein